jgi:hypothetical protein
MTAARGEDWAALGGMLENVSRLFIDRFRDGR